MIKANDLVSEYMYNYLLELHELLPRIERILVAHAKNGSYTCFISDKDVNKKYREYTYTRAIKHLKEHGYAAKVPYGEGDGVRLFVSWND